MFHGEVVHHIHTARLNVAIYAGKLCAKDKIVLINNMNINMRSLLKRSVSAAAAVTAAFIFNHSSDRQTVRHKDTATDPG